MYLPSDYHTVATYIQHSNRIDTILHKHTYLSPTLSEARKSSSSLSIVILSSLAVTAEPTYVRTQDPIEQREQVNVNSHQWTVMKIVKHAELNSRLILLWTLEHTSDHLSIIQCNA